MSSSRDGRGSLAISLSILVPCRKHLPYNDRRAANIFPSFCETILLSGHLYRVGWKQRKPRLVNPEQEVELIARAQGGERSAFEELASLHNDSLRRAIRYRMGAKIREKVDPDDVLQETLLRAFRSMGDFELQGEGSFRRWLEGIAANLILDSSRRQRRRREFQILREPEANTDSPSRGIRREERFRRLRECVDGLSQDYQTVIRLSRIEGLKIQQIAQRMNRSPSAVKNLLLRAMKQLKSSFGDTESLSLPRKDLGNRGATNGE